MPYTYVHMCNLSAMIIICLQSIHYASIEFPIEIILSSPLSATLVIKVSLVRYVYPQSYKTSGLKKWSNFMCTEALFSHVGSHIEYYHILLVVLSKVTYILILYPVMYCFYLLH